MSEWRQAVNLGSLKARALRPALSLGLAVVIWMTLMPTAQGATDTLDQSQEQFGMFTSQKLAIMAQTFTAGAIGPNAAIDKVRMVAWTPNGATTFTVQIQTLTAGHPSGTARGSTTFTSTALICCRQWQEFSFSPAVSITAGTQYAIVVLSRSGWFQWYDTSGDPYPGGALMVSCTGCPWFSGGTFGGDFAFETWVTTAAVNSAPTVAADNATVSTGEGSNVTNTGTFSGGDTVSLSASAGTVTKTGAGTWSWSQPTVDEGPGQTITITADDGHGHTAQATFSTSIGSVPPKANIEGAPSSASEGSSVELDGGGTSPSTQDNQAGYTYSWNVTKNGNAYATGSGYELNFQPDDEGTYVVTLHATDDGGFTGTTSATIIGSNVAPTATILGVSPTVPLVITPQEPLNFSGKFTDPGTKDSHTVTWTFGDGTSSTSTVNPGGPTSFSISHAYSAPGNYTATLTVADDDGGTSRVSTTVTVLTAAQAMAKIGNFVQSLSSLNGGQKNSLMSKINAAAASAERGDSGASCNQLNALINEVEAQQNAGHLSGADAGTITGATRATQLALGCFRPLVDFLSGL